MGAGGGGFGPLGPPPPPPGASVLPYSPRNGDVAPAGKTGQDAGAAAGPVAGAGGVNGPALAAAAAAGGRGGDGTPLPSPGAASPPHIPHMYDLVGASPGPVAGGRVAVVGVQRQLPGSFPPTHTGASLSRLSAPHPATGGGGTFPAPSFQAAPANGGGGRDGSAGGAGGVGGMKHSASATDLCAMRSSGGGAHGAHHNVTGGAAGEFAFPVDGFGATGSPAAAGGQVGKMRVASASSSGGLWGFGVFQKLRGGAEPVAGK